MLDADGGKRSEQIIDLNGAIGRSFSVGKVMVN